MRIRIIVGICWMLIAVFYFVIATAAVLDQLPKWFQVRFGISWVEYLPGIGAIGCGAGLIVGTRTFGWLALVLSSIAGAYLGLYLIFGGEGHPLLRLAGPALLLVLCMFTWRAARSILRERSVDVTIAN